jgi:hypothetical protein
MAIDKIMGFLIERYWRDLHIRPALSHAAIDLSQRGVTVDGKIGRLSARTIKNMLKQRTAMPVEHTCRVLAELFRPAIQHIEWTWFHLPFEEFCSKINERGDQQQRAGVNASQGSPAEQEDDPMEWLGGTYVAYRHAFSASTIDRIAREVLHVCRDGGGFAFRMSFLPGASSRSESVLEFQGSVEVIGSSLMLLGRSVDGGPRKRARVLFVGNNLDQERPELRNYRLGLLSSTRESDGAPCCACVLLVRVQNRRYEGEDLTSFMRDVTRTDTFDKIIGRDFTSVDHNLLRLFLDNRPSRSPKDMKDELERQLQALEGPGQRDPVLRIAQDRFERNMEVIFQHALADSSINPPFGEDWEAPPPEPAGNGDHERAHAQKAPV